MVCIPCIVIPFLLWFFHKYIQPLIAKFLPWKAQIKNGDNKATQDNHKVTKPKDLHNQEASWKWFGIKITF